MSAKLTEISTDHGFLEDARISFKPGLNCIIGARGTCKSTIIETIRFAFDCDPKRVQEMTKQSNPEDSESSSHFGLLQTTLGGGTATCRVNENGNQITIERDIDSEPRIYKEGIKQIEQSDLLSKIEIYSQGELQRIAEDSAKRLELVDRPNKERVSRLLKERSEQTQQIAALGPKIQATRQNLETLKTSIKAWSEFKNQLDELQQSRPKLSDKLETEHKRYADRQLIISKTKDLLSEKQTFLNWIRDQIIDPTPFLSFRELHKTHSNSSLIDLAIRIGDFGDFLSELKTSVEDFIQSEQPTAALRTLETDFEKESETYYSMRKEQAVVNESLKKEDVLKANLKELEKTQEKINQFTAQLDDYINQRQLFRSRIDEVNDEIYRLRVEQVDKINSKYNDRIMLTLKQASRSSGYRKFLDSILHGSRLRNRETLSDSISSVIPPTDLVTIVEEGDSKRLADLASIDQNTSTKLISYLYDNASFFEVEGFIFEDELEITMFDDGVAKKVDQLSKGQRATAMLPLILREADYPLIFDQPEDDLDNRFIYQTLVEQIQELKKTRQLIFITHNANIPVLGEAEQVIVMKMLSPIKADIPECGSVDDVKEQILGLLEGGAEAFKRRQTKYIDLLS